MFTPSIRFLYAMIYLFFSIFKNEKKRHRGLKLSLLLRVHKIN